jgi:DNA-binding CsgD family transcriptional regulator
VRLVEREDLLAQLGELSAEGGRLAFLAGEAGVGKTSVTRELAARANGRVLWGACENLTTASPLGPFLDIAEVAAAGEPGLVARALLDELRTGTLLVLEDLHWADQATLDVLRVLGRRIDRTRALAVATYRDDEVGEEHPLRLVLGELASAAGVARLSVPPLSVDAVRTLAAPAGADGDAIYRLTAGNAFFVTEVLATGGGDLPATVRDAVLARGAALEPAARRLLDVASLVPARCELWILAAVAPEDFGALEGCVDSGVLLADRQAVAFRHELARLAFESAVGAPRRRVLHAEILRALSSPPLGESDPARLAHHAEEAGDAAAVLEHAPIAARRADAMGSHREAYAQWKRALRLGDAMEAPARAAALDELAQQASTIGRHEEARAARVGAIELREGLGDRIGHGGSLARLPMPLVALGRNDEAEAASSEAIELLERHEPSPELIDAYTGQSYMRMLARDNAEGVRWGKKARALAERIDDADRLATALVMLGTSHLMAGEIDEGVEHLDRVLRTGSSLRVANALTMLASGLGEMWELERAEEYSNAFLAHAEEHGNDPTYVLAWLACVRVYRGAWDEGTALAQRVLETSQSEISLMTALIAVGRVRARRGDPGAFDVLDSALERARPGGHLQRLGHVHAARAEAEWLAGRVDRALEEASAAYPLALEKRHLWFAGELAYWRWKGGESEAMPEWIAPPFQLQLQGRARAAAEGWRDRGAPYEAARALAESSSDDDLLEALAVFDDLGALPAARDVRRTLRDRGAAVPRGPRKSTRSNPAELTERELDVLRLVAEGLRNSEVADELVLSTRTVDHHVSAILRKLQVRTRGEAVAAAGRLGLLEDR